ncbi:scarecrow-like protein 14 [Miscanthus floridulus]|uniref:scarecrow-like protein 14 n=1 Tax=Miscanthus floridulus TaxID=154761 RepID=UPI0034593645
MGTVEPANMLSPPEGSCCFKDVVSMAFLRDMEEANRFLLGADGYTVDCRGRKKRLDVDGDDEQVEGRSSKQMAADGEDSEEATAREMLDKLMLNGDDEPILVDDMQELRAAMDMAKTPSWRSVGTREDLDQQQQWHHSSPSGNATQRLAHCFAEGLQVWPNGTGNLHYRSSSLMSKSASSSSGVQLKAMQFFMATCCFLQVNILFSNKSIYKSCRWEEEAAPSCTTVWDHGLQWANPAPWLTCREGRATGGVGSPTSTSHSPGSRPAWPIEEAGRRLTACARQLGVPFRFHGNRGRN